MRIFCAKCDSVSDKLTHTCRMYIFIACDEHFLFLIGALNNTNFVKDEENSWILKIKMFFKRFNGRIFKK